MENDSALLNNRDYNELNRKRIPEFVSVNTEERLTIKKHIDVPVRTGTFTPTNQNSLNINHFG